MRMSRKDGQIPFIRRGGYYINDDKTKAGFDDPATQKGIAEYIGWQTDYDFSQPRVISLILVKQNVSSPVKAL